MGDMGLPCQLLRRLTVMLTRSLQVQCERVAIIGYDKDENEYFASSIADGGTILWLMARLIACMAPLVVV